MRKKETLLAAVIFLAAALSVPTCSFVRDYGKIRPQTGQVEKVTIQQLYDNWNDYTIYYAGSSPDHPAAIVFDPKSDRNTLIGNTWIKVEDQRSLSKLIGRINAFTRWYPEVWRILGPDDELYGYVFSSSGKLVTKVADDRTLYMYSFEGPSYYDHRYRDDW